MTPISKIPRDQRPRERLRSSGVEALNDCELLALILRHGIPGQSALELAANLLASYGGLGELARARPEELAIMPGIGAAKAAALVAAFQLAFRVTTSGGDDFEVRDAWGVAMLVRSCIAYSRRERVIVLVCDSQNRVRHQIVVAEGTVDHAPLPIREILNAVLRHDGRAFAVAHNHPSGDPEPSTADRQGTRSLMDAARIVGLRFLDHVVVAGEEWASATPLEKSSH
jgi:DNA repair protein RadC